MLHDRRRLVVDTGGGRLTAPLDPDADACAVVRRLAQIIRPPATWQIIPPRP